MADFLGVSNLMEAEAQGRQADGNCKVTVGDFEMSAAHGTTDVVGRHPDRDPARAGAARAHSSEGPNRIPGMIERPVYLGNSVQLLIRLANGDRVQALIQNAGEEIPYRQGDAVKVYMPADALPCAHRHGQRPGGRGRRRGSRELSANRVVVCDPSYPLELVHETVPDGGAGIGRERRRRTPSC